MDFMLGWTMVHHHNVQAVRTAKPLRPAQMSPGRLETMRRRLRRAWRPPAWSQEATGQELSAGRAPHCR